MAVTFKIYNYNSRIYVALESVLTFQRPISLSYRNQSIDLQSK